MSAAVNFIEKFQNMLSKHFENEEISEIQKLQRIFQFQPQGVFDCLIVPDNKLVSMVSNSYPAYADEFNNHLTEFLTQFNHFLGGLEESGGVKEWLVPTGNQVFMTDVTVDALENIIDIVPCFMKITIGTSYGNIFFHGLGNIFETNKYLNDVLDKELESNFPEKPEWKEDPDYNGVPPVSNAAHHDEVKKKGYEPDIPELTGGFLLNWENIGKRQ